MEVKIPMKSFKNDPSFVFFSSDLGIDQLSWLLEGQIPMQVRFNTFKLIKFESTTLCKRPKFTQVLHLKEGSCGGNPINELVFNSFVVH